MSVEVALALMIASLETATRISLMIQKAQAENRAISAEEWRELKEADASVREKLVELYNKL
jgi:hypothetical protein